MAMVQLEYTFQNCIWSSQWLMVGLNDMRDKPSPRWRCIDISFLSLLLLHKTPQYNCWANQLWETMSPDRLNEQLLRGGNYATWMRETFSQRYHQSGGRKQYSVSLWQKYSVSLWQNGNKKGLQMAVISSPDNEVDVVRVPEGENNTNESNLM